jgi:cytochrome c556
MLQCNGNFVKKENSMKKIAITSIAIALTAAAIHAHTVENPAVQKRMDVMKEIKGAMGVLGGMAKGAIAFDATAAGAAQNTLIEQSGMVAATFEANETDPKSEALPSIWENWDTFVEMADDLTFAAEGLDASSLDGVRGGLGNIGASCGACHKKFRM